VANTPISCRLKVTAVWLFIFFLTLLTASYTLNIIIIHHHDDQPASSLCRHACSLSTSYPFLGLSSPFLSSPSLLIADGRCVGSSCRHLFPHLKVNPNLVRSLIVKYPNTQPIGDNPGSVVTHMPKHTRSTASWPNSSD
jgi:hypothetical protein